MRTSIIIAAHNEGENLVKTVASCVEICGRLEHEIIVADDASRHTQRAARHRKCAATAVRVLLLLAAVAFGPSAAGQSQKRVQTSARPIVLTTDADIENGRQRIKQGLEPSVGAWREIRRLAERTLTLPARPYLGADHEDYFRVGIGDAGRARNLAVAFLLSGDRRFADKARELLLVWAAEKRQYPFSLKSPSHSAGLVLGRVVVPFADAYALLFNEFDADQRQGIERWFAAMAEEIHSSREIWVRGRLPKNPPPYLGRQNFNNHLSAHNMGLAAIGYATGDQRLVAYALIDRRNPRNLVRMIYGVIVGSRRHLYMGDPTLTRGAPNPQRGEIYDRYRTVGGKGLVYCQLHLRLLTVCALMAKNNGHPFDFFAYRADAGQSIQDAFEFYSEFVLTGDRRAHTGYYAGDKAVRVGFLPLMEIAHRIYPDNARFTLVLQARPRVRYDVETFGWTAPLLHACDDVVDRVGQWEFEIAQEMEGWSIDRNLKMQVRDGQLHLQLTGSGPGILSPAELELSAREFPRLLIRMRNETSDDRANVFFTTDKHTSFAGSDLFFDVHPHDDQYRDYVIDMTRHARWTGQLKQLRIDVVHSTSEGKVAVDAIRLLRESPDRHSAQ